MRGNDRRSLLPGLGLWKTNPLLTRLLLLVIVVTTAAFAISWHYLKRSLPDALIRLKPGDSSIRIARDSRGVPQIEAMSDGDAFFGLGYAHAQDRLWQLELERRTAQGTLSEIFGGAAIDQDRWIRTLGLYAAAESAWPALSPEAQSSLTRYADGVNAVIGSRAALPPEFIFLGVRPQPWTEIDSLAVVKRFALALSGNVAKEVPRYLVAERGGNRQLLQLLGVDAKDRATLAGLVAQTQRSLPAPRRNLPLTPAVGVSGVGSNAWVVAPRLTDNGAAILANDVHLSLQIPSPWYVARLKGPTLDVQGMTLVGLPLVVFGRNSSIAWGGTNLMADTQDLYVQLTDPQNPSRYQSHGEWIPYDVHREAISVRSEFPSSLRTPLLPVEFEVRRTRAGPIVGRELGITEASIALKWTALDPGDMSYESLFRVGYARNWSEFREAFRPYVAPALNLVFADQEGNIGMLAVGKIPIRGRGLGLFPVPGWREEFAWTGYIPFDEMPQQFNPEAGYLVAANHNIVGVGYPFHISSDWASPSRAKRIAELLGSEARVRSVSMRFNMEVQLDVLDRSAATLGQYLAGTSLKGNAQLAARESMKHWDGRMGAQESAAAIFHVWSRHLRQELFAGGDVAERGRVYDKVLLKEIAAATTDEQVLEALTDQIATSCDAPTDKMPPCGVAVQRSLDSAIRELTRLRGSNIDQWRWGDLQESVYISNPFPRSLPWKAIFDRRWPSGGSANTINIAVSRYRWPLGYEQVVGPAFRQIITIGTKGARHVYVNSTGQSGHPFSSHYDDMIRPLQEGRYFEISGAHAEIPPSSVRP